jgi:hypothetical protein
MEIGIISTDRSRNCAYVYLTRENPYWSTNAEVKLDWIESIMGCKFEDGDHPFVKTVIEEDYQLL